MESGAAGLVIPAHAGNLKSHRSLDLDARFRGHDSESGVDSQLLYKWIWTLPLGRLAKSTAEVIELVEIAEGDANLAASA